VLPAVAEVFSRGRFILGPEVAAFEKEVATHLGAAHAVGCASGTDALVLALRALGVGPGDEVIVPAYTFAATAGAVVLAGATPVFADVEADTFALDPLSVRELLGPRTRAVVVVHLFGQCARLGPLRDLCAQAGLFLIEDAAQAFGARWQGAAAGTLGEAAAFSFHPTKNLPAPGDGGMVTTMNADVAQRLGTLRAHGAREPHVHETIGTNSRLDELHAAVLRIKLRRLERWNDKRRETAARYRAAMSMTGGNAIAPVEVPGAHHVYNNFTIRTPARSDLTARLDAAGIGWAVYYRRPLHLQQAFAQWARGPLPRAERIAAEALSLPVHPWLTPDEVERVAEALAA
jgi:dTDP-4-amino-4,6-dideoxygalactose transaminase